MGKNTWIHFLHIKFLKEAKNNLSDNCYSEGLYASFLASNMSSFDYSAFTLVSTNYFFPQARASASSKEDIV